MLSKKWVFFALFFPLYSFLSLQQCYAVQKTLILSDTADQYEVAYGYIDIYEDRGSSLSIEKISSPGFSREFKSNYSQIVRNSNNTSTYWLKLTIKNISSSGKNWLFEFFDSSIRDISFFAPDQNGGFIEQRAGNKLPFTSKVYKHKNFSFQLPDIKKTEFTCYVRVHSEELIFLYGYIRSYHRFVSYALNEYYFLGLFYGIILAMALYNFLLFIAIKDKTYLFFVLYALSSGFLCMAMDGTGFQYLWPTYPGFNQSAFSFATFLMVVWALMYVQGFIILKGSKLHFKLLEILIVVRILLFILSQTIYCGLSEWIAIDIIILLICYISGILSFRKGNTSSRYFVLGFTFLFLGYIISNLTINSVLGFSLPNNILTVYSFNLGLIIEMIMLSYALADRVKLIMKERTVAQIEVINQLKENDHLKEKLNKELEQKVIQRTTEISLQKNELELKNEELAYLYNEIKENIIVAKWIQESILPPIEVIRKHLSDCYVVYKPKDVVSGDFYWFESRDENIYLAVVDCTGHGVSGAFMSLIGYNILNQIIRNPENNNLNAAQVLDKLNEGVIDTLHQKKKDAKSRDGMDINLCIINPKKRILSYAGAVNYLYIVRNKELIKLVADPFSIGIPRSGEILKFTNHDFKLKKDDMLIQYTDGYADQIGGPTGQKKFLYPNFREMFINICELPTVEQENIVSGTIDKWRGNQEQTDDILVVGIKVL